MFRVSFIFIFTQVFMTDRDLKPIEEALYLTDIANSDCSTIISTLNVQGEKLQSIKNKNTQTNNILLRTNKLTKHIMKRRRVIGFILVMLVVLFGSIWLIYKI